MSWVSLLAAGTVAVLLAGLAGCGPEASTQARSASSSSSPSATSAAPAAGTGDRTRYEGDPAPVPAGFAATSVTFTSADEAFVLGTAPCAQAPCTVVVRTLDRGASWRALPAPAEPVGPAGARAVWGIRFATPEHGFVFGAGLWETTDGGERWTRDLGPNPGDSILSLAIVRGQVLALTARCAPGAGCQPAVLERRALDGGSWQAIAKVPVGNLNDPDDLIATQAGVAAVIQGRDVLVTADGGLTFTANPTPCPAPEQEPSVAVTGPTGLALLCTGEGFTGHTIKQVYLSADDGAHWTRAGAPSPDGDGGTIAATTTGDLAIATESAASWLFFSPDAGVSWRIVATNGDGGAGWADLGFTTAADGVVVHGPAISDGNAEGRPGQLDLTSDGGAAWHQVSF